jgi:hypothetical protein
MVIIPNIHAQQSPLANAPTPFAPHVANETLRNCDSCSCTEFSTISASASPSKRAISSLDFPSDIPRINSGTDIGEYANKGANNSLN